MVNVGQNILTAAAQAQALSSNDQDNNIAEEIDSLKCQLKKLEEQIKNN
ncbi:MAG: hypothetical protein ACRDBO_13825 [Lachnospiraceae bacterium]